MSKSKTILSRCRSVWNTLFSKAESPRDMQERNDLYKIALAATFRDFRRNAWAAKNSGTSIGDSIGNSNGNRNINGNSNRNIYSTSRTNETREELERLFDEASEALEKNENGAVYDQSIRSLRQEVQQLIRPQVTSLLKTCQTIETTIPTNTNLDLESDEYVVTSEANKRTCRDVLYEEQCTLLDSLDTYYSDKDEDKDNFDEAKKMAKQIPFLNKKLSAIQSIASFYDWEHFYLTKSNTINDTGDENANTTNANAKIDTSIDSNGADEFGYIESTDEQVNNSIRYYQMINLSRAALIKQQLGYSVIALKSTLPNAGRGIFIDGNAPAGSILAFFPGEVWPKEHLLNTSSIAPFFKKDPRYQLSIRYDDILLDCRKAPYTVLDDTYSNAFAVAHIANHPSKYDVEDHPNCSTLAIDFIEDMKLKELNLDRFVPNTYKRMPMMMGPQAVDKDSIFMHSMGLLAAKDVQNEELFYDYRLSSGSDESHPKWYSIINKEELDNRWHHKD